MKSSPPQALFGAWTFSVVMVRSPGTSAPLRQLPRSEAPRSTRSGQYRGTLFVATHRTTNAPLASEAQSDEATACMIDCFAYEARSIRLRHRLASSVPEL